MAPSFKKRPLESETYAAEGGNVTIRCNPEAAPRPMFIWRKDNRVLGLLYICYTSIKQQFNFSQPLFHF